MAVTQQYATFVDKLPVDLVGNANYKYGMYNQILHLDDVYLALVACTQSMETRVQNSLDTYMTDPDVQANLQQLQYDLQSWNLALTTCTNMHKNMADALKSIVSNLR